MNALDQRHGPAGRLPAPLLALALAAFAIGTAEFVIVGLVPEVAADTGVSLPRAGLLVTGYALGVALGAPPLAVLTAKARPYRALSLLMLLFIAGNALSALAPDYGWLLAGRVVASLTHGAFFGLGATVAASLVAPNRKSAAIAIMFTGLTLANVLGVPAGAWIGHQWGWRATFWTVTVLGVLVLLGLRLFLPRSLPRPVSGAGAGSRILRRPRLWAALGVTALGFGGIFATLTFITPLLQAQAGLSAAQTNVLLLVFGVGLTLGNTLGGWSADRWPRASMPVILATLAAIEVVLYFTSRTGLAAGLTIFLWGMAAFATAPGLQSRVLEEAADAPALASTLNIGAFNLGNAFAAWLGAQALESGLPLRNLPLLSAALAVTALVLAVAGHATARALSPAHR